MCSICLDEFSDEEKVIQLLCHRSHIFHQNCLKDHVLKSVNDACFLIDKWYNENFIFNRSRNLSNIDFDGRIQDSIND